MRRPAFLAVVSAAAALLAPGVALAAGPPDDLSGVDQYVEDIPTSEGPKPAGSGGKASGNPLPPTVTQSLADEGGSDAAALEAIATDPSLGAPGEDLSGRVAVGPAGEAEDVSLGSALSGGFGALRGADGRGSGGVLLLVLVGLTTVIVVAAARRSRRRL